MGVAGLILAMLAFPAKAYTIRNDGGGEIILYALRFASYIEAGTRIRFESDCASACTIFLGLPPEQLCVGRWARFRFHLPYGGSERANRGAEKYLMLRYPKWTRDWIAAQGGLKKRFITMTGQYARRFLEAC